MRRPTKPTKALPRTGLILLCVLALVGSTTVAWGHGTVAGGADRVHTCMIPVLGVRLLRVVESTDPCLPLIEQGLDFPHNRTVIGVDIGAPVTQTLSPGMGVLSAPVTVQCTPNPPPPNPPVHRAIGATVSHTTDLVLSVTRPGLGNTTTWEVAFIPLTGGDKTVTVAPICLRLFGQV